MRSPRHAHTTAIKITFAVLLTAALAACSSDSDLPPPASATPPPSAETPSLNLTPAEQQAVEEAQALFDDFMTAYVEEAASGEPFETAMGPVIGGRTLEFLTGELTRSIQTELAENRNNNYVRSGNVEWNFMEVDAIDLDRTIADQVAPTIWMLYCIDMTSWSLVDRDSGQPTGPPGTKTAMLVELVWFDDDAGARSEGWRVAAWEVRDQSC